MKGYTKKLEKPLGRQAGFQGYPRDFLALGCDHESGHCRAHHGELANAPLPAAEPTFGNAEQGSRRNRLRAGGW